MLITFKSRAHADVVMFGEIALKLINFMGRSNTVPNAIEPESIPQALESLREGIALHVSADKESEDQVDDDEEARPVSLYNRALPLVELLQAAREENVPVMWEEGGRNY